MSTRRLLFIGFLLFAALSPAQELERRVNATRESLGGKRSVSIAYLSLISNPAYRPQFLNYWDKRDPHWRPPTRYEAVFTLYKIDKFDREAIDRVVKGKSRAAEELLSDRRAAIESQLALLREFANEWYALSGEKTTAPFERKIRERDEEMAKLLASNSTTRT